MTMKIGLHGGLCCGVKVIHALGRGPQLKYGWEPELHKNTLSQEDFNGYHFEAGEINFFRDAAPKESKGDRFVRYVDYIRKRRPSHIIEAVIAVRREISDFFQEDWDPFLRGQGFKPVTGALNSNSQNTCVVYHLVIKDGKNV